MRTIAALPLVGLLSVVGCRTANGADSSAAGPRLVALGDVRLAETDRHFVGHPAQLTVDSASGDILVGDIYGKRVLEFTRQGAFVREYGGIDSDTARLKALYDVALVATQVIAVDEKHHELSVFSRPSGQLTLREPIAIGEANFAPGPRGSLIAGGLDTTHRALVSRLDVASRTRTTLVPISGDVARYPALRGSWLVSAASWADTTLIALGPSNSLLVVGSDGQLIERVILPVALRRGVPESVVRAPAANARKIANSVSVIVHLHRLSNGDVAIVFLENTLGADPSDRHKKLWLGVLSRDRSRACVDTPIPVTSVSMPFPAFRGDTLFIFTQNVAAQTGTTVVRTFVGNTAACQWLPTSRSGD
jgi:hypothetical protein